MPDVTASPIWKRPYEPSTLDVQPPPLKRSATLSPNQYSSYFNQKQSQREIDKEKRQCFYCHETGHMRMNCPLLKKKSMKKAPSLNAITSTPSSQLVPMPMIMIPPAYPNWPMPTSPAQPTGTQPFFREDQGKKKEPK